MIKRIKWGRVMIQFINVTKEYRNGTVGLRDINVKIEDGEFTFLVGASGAGKSTFTKLMIREIAPTSGSILIDGKGIHRLKKREIPIFRRNMGFVFQNYRLLSDRTAFENVAFALEALGYGRDDVKKKAMFALEQMGLANRAQHFPAELSGGEQQRVAIARAIVNNPKILVADEPTGNLDFETSREIMDILYEINAGGTTVLMATHDRGIVEKSHHRILTLDNGRLIGDDNLLAGYTLGHSKVKRNANVISEQLEQKKADRGFHAATEEIGRVKSRLSFEDTKPQKVEIKQKTIINPPNYETEKAVLTEKNPVFKKESERLLTEKNEAKESKPIFAEDKAEKTSEMRAEQIKAVLEKSSNLKADLAKKAEISPSEPQKLPDSILKQEVLAENTDEQKVTEAKSSAAEDWERLILEAFE